MTVRGVVDIPLNDKGFKGGIWGRGDGGCLRYLIMIVILMVMMFTLLFILD